MWIFHIPIKGRVKNTTGNNYKRIFSSVSLTNLEMKTKMFTQGSKQDRAVPGHISKDCLNPFKNRTY